MPLFRGSRAPLLRSPESVVRPGLLAEYRFDEGSGTTVTDYSGNGYAGTFGGSPTWVSNGLSFNGSQLVSIGVPIGSVKTVVAMMTPSAGATFQAILGSTVTNDCQWWLQASWPWSPPLALPQIRLNNVGVTVTYDFLTGTTAQVVAWVQNGTQDKLYLDGLEVTRYVGQSNTAASGRTGTLSIGLTPNFPNFGLNGRLHGMLIYDRALSAVEVARNTAVLRERAARRGTIAVFTNSSTTRQLVCDGDSITQSTGAAWPTSMTLAQTYSRFNMGIGGQSIAQIAAANVRRNLIVYAPNAPVNVYVLFAGTNDIAGGASAATTFANLVLAAEAALNRGWKVVIVPMLSRVGLDTQKNAYNALIAARSWGSSVAVVAPADMPNLTPDGAYANATYFSDQIHPTSPAGTGEIGAAVAAKVDTFG